MIWKLRDRTLTIGHRPLIVGILNITADSFSDGGQFFDPKAALDRALQMQSEGADILDLGAESTRPGSEGITAAEETRRLLPVLDQLLPLAVVPISIDTTKASVAAAALSLGAHIINDISALEHDPEMLAVVKQYAPGLILMHKRGQPKTMQDNPHYDDASEEVNRYLLDRLAWAQSQGIDPSQIVLDPGIGFGKTLDHNLTILAGLNQLTISQRPILIGVSRKGMIGQITGRPVTERVAGSIAVACHCSTRGVGHLWRVHDVQPSLDAARIIEAINSTQG